MKRRRNTNIGGTDKRSNNSKAKYKNLVNILNFEVYNNKKLDNEIKGLTQNLKEEQFKLTNMMIKWTINYLI